MIEKLEDEYNDWKLFNKVNVNKVNEIIDYLNEREEKEVLSQPVDTSHIQPKRWKPEIGEKYWVFSIKDTVLIRSLIYLDTISDNGYYVFGNCFRTQEEAIEASNKIKNFLNSL